MEVFLSECKDKLNQSSDNQKIKIVLGNEACDLDSAVSSLVLAFSLSQINTLEDHIILPVLNVQRKDVRLHSEVSFFLEETSINLDNLICKDEINIKQLANSGRLSVVLVDHNVLSSDDSFLLPYIELVYDHHVVENPKLFEHCTTIIEPVGSCCTLIAELLFNTEPLSIDPHAAMLLYGTIVLDTVCLDESAKRVTEKDRQMVTKLETVLEGISREEVFQALQKAKFDVAGFSPQQLLQKDLKVVTSHSSNIAIASIPALLDELTNGTSMEQVLQEFSSGGHYQSVVLLGSHISKDGKPVRRQLAVFSPDRKSIEKLSEFLKNLVNPSLELEPLSTSSSSILLFEQKATTLTRKFVLPAVKKYLDQLDNAGSENDGKTVNDRSDVNSLVESGETAELSAHNYQLETVDFPDSPDHASLLQNMLQDSCEIKDESLRTEQPKSIVNSLKCYEGGDTDSPGSVRRKIYIHPSVLREDSLNDDQKSLSSLSNKSEPDIFSPTEDIVLPEEDDDIDTPEELEISDVSVGLESTMSEPIPEMSAAEEYEEERSWKMCIIGGEEKRIDMRVIEPYKKVLSHGGYHGETRNAIIIFSACYLPDRSRKDYDYVMDNLFLYVLSTLDQLVAEDYVLVYLHGATERGNMPSFGWLKRCYRMIDRRLRKNLKGLFLVHPTFWLKTIVIMTRPFISSKFSRKLKFVNSLEELSSLIPMDHVCIPDKVKSLDFERMIKMKKKQGKYKKFIRGPTNSLPPLERY